MISPTSNPLLSALRPFASKLGLLVALIAAGSPSPAQVPAGFIAVSATKIYSAGGIPLAHGSLCARVTLSSQPSSLNVGGGGQTTDDTFCVPITNGAATINLPDTNLTQPLNACVSITVLDAVGRQILKPGYDCVQPTSAVSTSGSPWCATNATTHITTCNFDLYPPNFKSGVVIQAGPTGLQGVQGVPGGVGPSATGYWDESSYPESTFAGRVTDWDTAMGSNTGALNVTHPVTLSAPITLSPGHTLRISSPMLWNALITLGSGAAVECDPGVQNNTTLSNYLVDFGSSTSARVEGCHVTTSGGVASGAYFAHVSGAVHPILHANELLGMGPVRIESATEIYIADNYSKNSTGAIDLYNVDRGYVLNNRVVNASVSGIQIFEGDANADHYDGATPLVWPGSVTSGHILVQGNTTRNTAFGIFTSNATGMTISNNWCYAAGDTCLDDEGGVQNIWEGNQVPGATGNFGISTFFETQSVTFRGNIVSRTDGGNIARLKHTDPNYRFQHQQLALDGNTFDCGGTISAGVYVENQGNTISITGNKMHNCTIAGIDRYQGTLHVDHNIMTFDAVTTTAFVAIYPPSLINGSLVTVNDNEITSNGAPAGSLGIIFEHQDFNTVDFYFARRNLVRGFPTSILYSGDSANIGAAFYVTDNDIDGAITQGGGNINRIGVYRNCNITLAISTCGQ